MPREREIRTDRDGFFLNHFRIISAAVPELQLSNREIDVLAYALSIAPNGVVSTKERKVIMEKLSLSPTNLSNIIKSLADKKVIERGKRKFTIHRSFLTEGKTMEYKITLRYA